MDPDEVAEQPVVGDERLGLAVVELEPLLDRLGRVVRPPFLLGAPMQALECHVVRDLQLEDDVESGRPISASIESSASACVIVRGKPSRTNPFSASSDWSRSRISSIIRSSGTSSPRSRIGCTRWPSSLPFGDRVAKHVAGRDVREPVLRGDALGLRPLAGPLDAEQKNV